MPHLSAPRAAALPASSLMALSRRLSTLSRTSQGGGRVSKPPVSSLQGRHHPVGHNLFIAQNKSRRDAQKHDVEGVSVGLSCLDLSVVSNRAKTFPDLSVTLPAPSTAALSEGQSLTLPLLPVYVRGQSLV
jgi:hypothetical protein